MRIWTAVAALLVAAGGGAAYYALRPLPQDPPAPMAEVRLVQPNPEVAESRYVLDISVHTAGEIESLLARVEKLTATMSIKESAQAPVALVLHGPEIEFFTRANRESYRDLVSRAAALDAKGLVDVKMCQTMMRYLGVKAEDVPPFVELVPYGPDEVKRLRRNGYVLM